jgi:hypothetical protein
MKPVAAPIAGLLVSVGTVTFTFDDGELQIAAPNGVALAFDRIR